jgi:O-antigen/teichoic acid export membrane protein
VTTTAAGRRKLIVQGITWTAAYQLLEVVVAFASMLVLVRILDARDYGRAAAVVAILFFLNSFNVHLFLEHALQLPDEQEPDWQVHWTYAFYIQIGLSVVGHVIAGLCWLWPSYRPIAKLLHIASFGLVLDWPSQMSYTMLRRNLQLRRLRIVAATGMLTRIATTMTLAFAGAGAYAIVIGGNVVPAIAPAIDLLVLRRWRPKPGWHRFPGLQSYTAPLSFGLQRVGAQAISGVRSAAEGVLLPAPLGFAALGLINRSQALYTTTFGRVGAVLSDVVYPFLPRTSHDRVRYASHATMYLRVMLLIALPAGLFVAEHGPLLSRVLYGTRWLAMDPLIRPGAIVSVSISVLTVAVTILMAAGRMRDCVAFEAIGAAAAIPALAVAWMSRQPVAYSWTCAVASLVVAFAALRRAAPLLESGWLRFAFVPPLVSALVGLGSTRIAAIAVEGLPPSITLVLLGLGYVVVNVAVMRLAFAQTLDDLLTHAPAGAQLRRALRLRAAPQALRHGLIPEMREDLS